MHDTICSASRGTLTTKLEVQVAGVNNESLRSLAGECRLAQDGIPACCRILNEGP
jgi:hypothetical protein